MILFHPSITFAALIGVILYIFSAQAHHGFTGRYDTSQPVWIEGTVREAYFGQPHPMLRVETTRDFALPAQAQNLTVFLESLGKADLIVRDDTRGRVVTIEFPPVRAFFELGVTVKIGDKVRLIALRNCEAPHQLRGQWIEPASGPVVARTGRVQSQVERC